jgi:hypothetical protein
VFKKPLSIILLLLSLGCGAKNEATSMLEQTSHQTIPENEKNLNTTAWIAKYDVEVPNAPRSGKGTLFKVAGKTWWRPSIYNAGNHRKTFSDAERSCTELGQGYRLPTIQDATELAGAIKKVDWNSSGQSDQVLSIFDGAGLDDHYWTSSDFEDPGNLRDTVYILSVWDRFLSAQKSSLLPELKRGDWEGVWQEDECLCRGRGNRCDLAQYATDGKYAQKYVHRKRIYGSNINIRISTTKYSVLCVTDSE